MTSKGRWGQASWTCLRIALEDRQVVELLQSMGVSVFLDFPVWVVFVGVDISVCLLLWCRLSTGWDGKPEGTVYTGSTSSSGEITSQMMTLGSRWRCSYVYVV